MSEKLGILLNIWRGHSQLNYRMIRDKTCLWYNREEIIVSANFVTEEFMVKKNKLWNVKHTVIKNTDFAIRYLDNSVSGAS